MILFAVHDDSIHSMAEPHVAQSVDVAMLSLGRFFIEHEDMSDRVEVTSLAVFGCWDYDKGVKCGPDGTKYIPAKECVDYYLMEVKKQNEEAVSDSDGSI